MTLTGRTKLSKPKPTKRPYRKTAPEKWGFTLTLDSGKKRISVRGVYRPVPDDENGDYYITLTDTKGNFISETVCWDQDDAVTDAALALFARWADLS